MYQRILVPVDGSETSKRALQTAVALAAEESAKLHVVHVCEERPVYVSMDTLPYPLADLREALHKEGEQVLAEAIASASEGSVKADGKLLVLDRADQRISDAVEQEAEAWRADLIVVGTHGRRGFRRLLLGSVAEHLIRIATRPVLLIRGG